MRKITVEIDCGESSCEGCQLQDAGYFFAHRVHHCGFFHQHLAVKGEKILRCPECLSAEVKE